MARININVGSNANDGTGDDLRTAMQKINTNFTELYGTTAEANDLVEDGTPQLGGNLDIQNYIITTNTTNGAISLQPNGSGSVKLGSVNINGTTIGSDDSNTITIDESLAVTGSATLPILKTNIISSDDSSVIQINDSVQVSGTLKSNGVITNRLNSDDSSAIEVDDDLLISGTVSTNSLRTNSLYSEEIQIVGNNISARRSNDDLVLSGSGTGTVKIGVIKFPTTDGVNGQVLQTNGAGQLSWGTSGVGSGVIFSADDSTSTAVAGGTLQVKGSSNISTHIAGDVLTITGPNLSSYLTAVPKTIDVNEISSGDSSAIQVNDGVNVSGTLTANTFVTNNISSSESTAIEVDDGMSVRGTLTANTFITNEISSSESSAIQINDSINVSGGATIAGSLTANTFITNNISSADSTAIQINDGVNISGTLTANTLATNEISSSESSAIQVNDSVNMSGNLNVAGTITGALAFSNLTGKPTTIAGYGITDAVSTSTTSLTVVGDDSTGTNFTIGETLKVTGSSGIAAAVSGDTLTISLVAPGSVGTIGDLIVTGQAISGGTNGDISIIPQGVGNINLDADRIRVGDLNTDVIISSNGSADLILKTDVDNPSVAGMGSITIGDGVAGVTTITTSDEGYLSVGNTTWDTLYSTTSVAARNKHGLSVSMDIDRNYSFANLDREHASAIGARFNILGTDPDNGSRTPYRTQHIELISALNGKSLISKGWITFDPSSKNAGITSIDSGGQMRGHAAGPVPLSIQNTFRNSTFGNAYVEETALVSSFTNFAHTSAQHTVTVNNLHGYQLAFDLASQGGDTVVDSIRSYVATGNYYTDGSATANNYYAFWAGQASEATNNWGVYIESADWENYLGGLTIVDSTIRADRSNENIYLETSGSGKVIVNDTLNVNTVELNEISSADSSAIQINDGVNISGTLSADTIDTNIISSSDSSAVTINDDLEVKSSLYVNAISSNDSSAVTINDNLEVKSSLYVNAISSNDSSAITINDDITITGSLSISGTLNVSTIVENAIFTNEIASADSSVVNVNDSLNVSGNLRAPTIVTNTISSDDSSAVQINDSVQISDNLTLGGLLTLTNKTVAQLLLLTPATGTLAYCTNETGGAQPVFYDGTNWRRMTDLTVIS